MKKKKKYVRFREVWYILRIFHMIKHEIEQWFKGALKMAKVKSNYIFRKCLALHLDPKIC